MLLGPTELLDAAGDVITVASGRQRQLLVALGLHNGATVSTDTIIEWLWPDALPTDPVATVQTNVSRLRRLLDDESITLTTVAGGYRLVAPPEMVDTARFEQLVSESRTASRDQVIEMTSAALQMWRGTPFAEIDHTDLDATRTRFEALRLEAIERRIEALGDLGRHGEVIALAEPHVLSYPTRERPVARLMESLYATGLQTEALARYRRLRNELVDQLGVDPSPELQQLEIDILQQDVSVAADARAGSRADRAPASDVRERGGTDRARMSQQIRFCHTDDGVRIAYATSGVGPPLVRAANWMTHLDYDWDNPVWQHWLRSLSDGRRLIRYDERGCGLSDWNVGEFSFEDWVSDLETIVDELELETFPLLGVSQGAAVAVAYAQRHPERVTRLVLVSGYPQGRLVRATTEEERAEAAVHVALARVGWGRDDPAFRQVFTSHFLPDGTREQWDSFNELQRRTTSAENAAQFMEVFGEIDVTALAPDVTCPTLIVHSRDELRVPMSSAHELASLIPDSRVCTLPSRNHLLIEEEPAWPMFLDELSHFLGDG